MTKVISNLGFTIQNKSPKGDTFTKADVSIELDDTKPVKEQLEWAKIATLKAWETESELLAEKLSEEELANSQEKRDLAIKALRNHNERLKVLEAKIKTS